MDRSNRQYVIIIGIQTVVIVIAVFYGLIKKFQAEQQRKVADTARHEAEATTQELLELLKKCESGK